MLVLRCLPAKCDTHLFAGAGACWGKTMEALNIMQEKVMRKDKRQPKEEEVKGEKEGVWRWGRGKGFLLRPLC